jgi:hypothetical protein
MATVWLVTVGDTEKNFRYKRDAVAWLVRLTRDPRPTPPVYRETPRRFVYYGPGDQMFVTRAWIDRLLFPPMRFYAVRTRVRKAAATRPPAVNASDPHAQLPGNLTPRDPVERAG